MIRQEHKLKTGREKKKKKKKKTIFPKGSGNKSLLSNPIIRWP